MHGSESQRVKAYTGEASIYMHMRMDDTPNGNLDMTGQQVYHHPRLTTELLVVIRL